LVDITVCLGFLAVSRVILGNLGPDDCHRPNSRTGAWRLLGAREWQLGHEGRAAASARLDPDAAAHPREQLAADVEAEAGAADSPGQVGVEAVELLEDPAVFRRRHSEAVVVHGEAHARAFQRDLDA